MDDPGPAVGGHRDDTALPLHLAPLVAAATQSPCPAAALRPLLARYGFDGLGCIVARTDGGATSGEIAWSTYPQAWAALYRRAHYAAVDPRLVRTRRRVTPCLWDADDTPAEGLAGHFLAAARRFGIRSGVAVAVHAGGARQVAVAFDAGCAFTDARRAAILPALGDLVLVAMALYEAVLSRRVAHAAMQRQAGPRLTPRECDCLKFAARGMTSADIGTKLAVTERTVNFHFGRLRRKLGALNRPEAIAKGVSLGLVQLD